MRGVWGIHPGWGVTAVRIAVALVFIFAGWGKVNAGLGVVGANFEKWGIPLGSVFGPFIAILELVGGTLLLLGIAGRWLGLLFTIEFIVAFFYVKLPNGFAGARIDMLLLAGSFLIFAAGPGKAAIDALWLEKETAGRRAVPRAA